MLQRMDRKLKVSLVKTLPTESKWFWSCLWLGTACIIHHYTCTCTCKGVFHHFVSPCNVWLGAHVLSQLPYVPSQKVYSEGNILSVLLWSLWVCSLPFQWPSSILYNNSTQAIIRSGMVYDYGCYDNIMVIVFSVSELKIKYFFIWLHTLHCIPALILVSLSCTVSLLASCVCMIVRWSLLSLYVLWEARQCCVCV